VTASARSTASPSTNERRCTRFRRPPRSRFTSGHETRADVEAGRLRTRGLIYLLEQI
jgi:hypothetical protein